MGNEKEYTFLKNIAVRLQLPIHEIDRDELSLFCESEYGKRNHTKGNDFEEWNKVLQKSSKKEMVYLENPMEDLNCLYITMPADPFDKMIVLGPFRKKDFKVAHGLMTEFAETIWKEPCKMQTYSFDIRKRHPLIDMVIQHINDDITGQHALRHIAKKFHVSPGHLSKLFTQEMGMSLTEYVNRKKIAYGEYLLSTTDEKIAVIAIMCGIKDNNYFSRLFKKYVGVSPIEYRKRG